MSLSVVVITRNESASIEACLASVPFADEWVVVDSGSTDDTCSIARRFGARVVETTDWPGFGPQKNRALAEARGDWVLSLDADERLSPELSAQIKAIVQSAGAQNTVVAYTVSRLSSFCGQWMRHGDWYPDHVLRLFKRGEAAFSNDLVHESVQCRGPRGHLSGHLLHESMPTLEECLDKMNRYSSGRARDQRRAGKRGGLGTAIGHGLWAFVRSYIVRGGMLDGRMGFIVALSIAEGTYYRYLKLWMLERGLEPSSKVVTEKRS